MLPAGPIEYAHARGSRRSAVVPPPPCRRQYRLHFHVAWRMRDETVLRNRAHARLRALAAHKLFSQQAGPGGHAAARASCMASSNLQQRTGWPLPKRDGGRYNNRGIEGSPHTSLRLRGQHGVRTWLRALLRGTRDGGRPLLRGRGPRQQTLWLRLPTARAQPHARRPKISHRQCRRSSGVGGAGAEAATPAGTPGPRAAKPATAPAAAAAAVRRVCRRGRRCHTEVRRRRVESHVEPRALDRTQHVWVGQYRGARVHLPAAVVIVAAVGQLTPLVIIDRDTEQLVVSGHRRWCCSPSQWGWWRRASAVLPVLPESHM